MSRKDLVVLLLLVVLCAVVATASPQFLSVANLQNITRLVGMYGIFSIGVGIVIITGGIDLSVGSMCALLGVLLSMMLVEWGWPASARTGGRGGARCRPGDRARTADHAPAPAAVHRHALRTAPLSRRRAVHRARFDEGVRHRRGLRVAAEPPPSGSVGGVPMPFVILCVVAAIAWLLVHRSVYGRHLFAVGHNEEASRYSGVTNARRRRRTRT